MANNFLYRMKQQDAGTGSLFAHTLIEDSGTGAILHADQAAAEGRLLTLHPDQLEPDPRQPRRAFHPDSILTLQQDIEANGQLQPILVGRPNEDGKYPIIFGERRWRAIAQSPTLDSVVAILRNDDLDEATIVLLQISENTQREDITAMEQAHVINRFVTLCKQHGRTQHAAAEALHMSPARLSKYLALVRAPEAIQALSTQGEIQDLEVLYALAKAFQAKPKETTALLDTWRKHAVPTSLRHAVTQLTGSDEPDAPQTGSAEPALHQEHSHPRHTPATGSTVQRASAVGIQSTDTDTHLIIEVGRKQLWFFLDPEAYRLLKELAGTL